MCCVLTGQRRALDPLKLHNPECWGQNLGPLEKVSALNCCTISPAPLYLRSSTSKSLSVPCCLLTILGETQICIIITTRSFFLVKTYGSGLERWLLLEDPSSVPGGSTISDFCRNLSSHAHNEK